MNLISSHITGLFFRKKAEHKRMKNGIEAEAIILNLQNADGNKNGQARIRLQLQVLPEKERNFIAETDMMIAVFDQYRIKEGGKVVVKFNPKNVKDVLVIRISE